MLRTSALLQLVLAGILWANPVAQRPTPQASSFAGSTVTFAFPPPNITASFPDPNFPDKTQVGFPGPTPTGDEAFAIETAPAIAFVNNIDPIIRPSDFDKPGSFDIVRSWGNLSPWYSFPAGTFGLPKSSPVVPEGCAIKQVHILHRHGARYPAGGAGPAAFAAKLHEAATGAGFSATGPLEFLNTWTFKLGEEILTPLGRGELYMLGVNARVRYGGLLKGFANLPVWRTTSQGNLQFSAGFFGVQHHTTSYHQLIEIEKSAFEEFNSTLASFGQCPNILQNYVLSAGHSTKWANEYTKKTIERLQKNLKGVQLTPNDIINMQEACAYESVALGYSIFCILFVKKEWESFQYYNGKYLPHSFLPYLLFWYAFGPGGPATNALGVGYVQEFMSRLTQTRITTFDTTVNATIVSSNITFPLDQPIYVDATHDGMMTAVALALNITMLSQDGTLPDDKILKNRV
ncbi:histidine phosphatase superfamily [Amylostereum chailletii]|nr:histidine phosphatase superfamily [Amylostereum chailletii]